MKLHNYHMVLTEDLSTKILLLSEKLKMSVSATAVYIIQKTIVMLEKYQFESLESDKISKYQRINWDDDINIYFDEKLFRKIKHICGTMMAFSIAIVIRKLLEIYFEYGEKYKISNAGICASMDWYRENYIKRFYIHRKNWGKRYIPSQLCRKKYYQLTFDDNFMLVEFDFS